MKFTHKSLLTCVAIAISIASIGCETLVDGQPVKKKKKDSSSWSMFKKKVYQTPQSLNVTWSHDVMTLPGKPPTRGFGGRLYFYNEKTQAIPVDGDLVVYGFDDTFKPKGTEDLSQADKRFRFTAEQLTTHFSEGELGASYSVWIPWDAAYGPHKKIMLIPTFMTKEGRMVRGAPANLNLPGKSNEDPNEGIIPQTSSTIPTVLPRQMIDARLSTPTDPSSGMRTTNIRVPSGMLMRQSHSPEMLAPMSASQNQNTTVSTDTNGQFQPNTGVMNSIGASTNNQTVQSQPSVEVPVQTASANSNTKGIMPSLALPVMRTNFLTTQPNGLAAPELAPVSWTGQPARSAPNSLPAQASPSVQQSAYPTR